MHHGGDDAGRPRGGRRSLGRPQRIVVVDDDEVQRAGLVASLTADAEVGAVETDTIASALGRSGWAGVDAVVVHLFTPARRGDQLAGIAVVERVRRAQVSRPPRVVALCGIAQDDPARVRAREAGATEYHNRLWDPSASAVCGALLRPCCDFVPAPSRPQDLVPLGITNRSRVNAAVAAAYTEALVPDAGWVGPRGRDRDARRARFNLAARLQPVGGDGLEPERDQTLPSLRQIQRLVTWATRPVELPMPDRRHPHHPEEMP